MAKRMLIDATHPEETRVVVLNGNRIEEFDFETSTKKQLKGNVYLAKVTRVEPSLQAAFVDYGGNRHGFLAFSEIHPDYWRIPVADREALLAEQAAHHAAHDDGEDETPAAPVFDQVESEPQGESEVQGESNAAPAPDTAEQSAVEETSPVIDAEPAAEPPYQVVEAEQPEREDRTFSLATGADNLISTEPSTPEAPQESAEQVQTVAESDGEAPSPATESHGGEAESQAAEEPVAEAVPLESVGGDEIEDETTRRRFKPMRHYKIQEVIKRRQVLLVQVVKEERGTKGAALTTYLSLAGRYCVLMPNTARGGGISRRITSAQDRKRLKSIIEDLDVPEGQAVILRTAGMERTKPEIKRDYEFLQRQWDDIRDLTLKSTAPCLIHEEGNLIKRAIRDLYSRDIDEILVAGEEGYRAAKAFMKTLMPSHVGRIQLYNDPVVPLFQRFQVESQLDEMHAPVARLKSGGYIVINPTEALVSIDVNSGRATRERHIEETAFKTNLEAADEIARQLRLRDLAGLIVIDFIDMEEQRNQHAVERRLKEAMKNDRARIQIGRISPFGLLELSRQRLRPSLLEVSSERCPHCAGTGFIRSTESAALHVLRAIEEEGTRLRSAEIVMHVPSTVALYILNHKRDALARIEARYGLRVAFGRDDSLIPPAYRLERTRTRTAGEPLPAPQPQPPMIEVEEGIEVETIEAVEAEGEAEHAESGEMAATADEHERGDGDGDGDGGQRRRRRRRRRRGRGDEHGATAHAERPASDAEELQPAQAMAESLPEAEPHGEEGAAEPAGAPESVEAHEDGGGERRRRRGRRGGRRRGRRGPDDQPLAPVGQDPVVDPHATDVAHASFAQDANAPSFEAPETYRPRRIEGPGDAYDWPWNRRAERFPDERQDVIAEEAPRQPAEQTAFAESERHAVAEHPAQPEPIAPAAEAEPATAEPARAEAEPATEQSSDTAVAAETSAQSEEPTGPPRRGWWRRLTQ